MPATSKKISVVTPRKWSIFDGRWLSLYQCFGGPKGDLCTETVMCMHLDGKIVQLSDEGLGGEKGTQSSYVTLRMETGDLRVEG